MPKDNLPYVEVAVCSTKAATYGSKWDDPPRGGSRLSKGYMMVDTGASLTLLTRKWCQAHNLKIVDPQAIPEAQGANGMAINITGMVPALTIRLSSSLELDLANVAVHDTGYYQALLGQDVLAGKPGLLSPATIALAPIGQKGATVSFEFLK